METKLELERFSRLRCDTKLILLILEARLIAWELKEKLSTQLNIKLIKCNISTFVRSFDSYIEVLATVWKLPNINQVTEPEGTPTTLSSNI